MITMTHATTIKVIDKISNDFDELVHEWSDNQREFLKVCGKCMHDWLSILFILLDKGAHWM